MHKLSTKPRIKLTGKAVWQCADAHLSRSGRTPNPPLRQAGTAIPHKAGKTITIKAPPKAAVIEQPSYPASMVKQLHGTTRREYRPPADLLRNMERASVHQQPLVSISTGQE